MTAAAWRIQIGEHGWIRELVDGAPIVTAVQAEAQQWATADEAQAVADALPPGLVPARVVPGPATPPRVYYEP